MDISMAFCVMLADVAVRLIYYGNSIIHSLHVLSAGQWRAKTGVKKAVEKTRHNIQHNDEPGQVLDKQNNMPLSIN